MRGFAPKFTIQKPGGMPPYTDVQTLTAQPSWPRPWMETLRVGSVQTVPSGFRTLVNGYRYIHYSSPMEAQILIFGFSFNNGAENVAANLPSVRIQLGDIEEGPGWIPFFSAQCTATFGIYTQAEPVLLMPEPYIMNAGHRIQLKIQNLSGSPISNAQVTFVGVRYDNTEEYVRVTMEQE